MCLLGLSLARRIPTNMRIIENTPIMPVDKNLEKWFNKETNDWSVVVFPKRYPISREDVKILDNWVTARLSSIASIKDSISRRERPEVTYQIAQQQLYVIDLGFSEIIRLFTNEFLSVMFSIIFIGLLRQVSLQSMERGELIHRMWRSSQELFETLITDLTRVTAELQSKLRQAQEQLEHVRSFS